MVNNMGVPTTDWETRFKQAYEEFQAEKKQICHDYEAKISDMDSKILELKRHVDMLKSDKKKLLTDYKNLERLLNDTLSDAAMYLEQVLANDKPIEGGCVVIDGSCIGSSYQEFVGILIVNGYAVKVIPIGNGKLKIIIEEGEVQKHGK